MLAKKASPLADTWQNAQNGLKRELPYVRHQALDLSY